MSVYGMAASLREHDFIKKVVLAKARIATAWTVGATLQLIHEFEDALLVALASIEHGEAVVDVF